MKNFFIVLFFTLFFILSFFMIDQKKTLVDAKESEEVKAIFLSYIEIEENFKNKNEYLSKQNIINILDNIKNYNFNTLILHVRAFADSIYDSDIFKITDSVLIDGSKPNYDILSFFVSEAHKRNIKVHAWVNPFRISIKTDLLTYESFNKLYNSTNKDMIGIVDNKGIFFNPANKDARDLIISGINEIVNKYSVDGILFDDYFYPDKKIDLKSYDDYVKDGGDLSIIDFRYEVILSFIKNVYNNIKKCNKNVLFSISPEGNIQNDYNKHFLDIKTILSNSGYVDYIMPQLYYGFKNSNKPYIETASEWNKMIKEKSIKLIPALAFYKVGEYDKYAGSGQNEWIENNDIISKEVVESRKLSNYYGFALFRYDYLFNNKKYNNNSINEIESLKEIIK